MHNILQRGEGNIKWIQEIRFSEEFSDSLSIQAVLKSVFLFLATSQAIHIAIDLIARPLTGLSKNICIIRTEEIDNRNGLFPIS